MKITRSQLRSIIKESILLESRKMKQQFYDKVRSKHPELDQAYYVHWIEYYPWKRGDLPSEKHIQSYPSGHGNKRLYHFSDFIDITIQKQLRNNSEISVNLVDPSGKTTAPHQERWGPVGIVLQGIPTFGGGGDTMSISQPTLSGKRRYPVASHDKRKDLVGDEDYEPEKYLKRYGDSRGQDIDFDQKGLFSREIKDFLYAYEEFYIVPKKFVGIVFHTRGSSEYEYEDTDMEGQSEELTLKKLRSYAEKYNVPLGINKDGIGNLYRSLYNGNYRHAEYLPSYI